MRRIGSGNPSTKFEGLASRVDAIQIRAYYQQLVLQQSSRIPRNRYPAAILELHAMPMAQPQRTSIRAAWLFPVDSAPIRGGTICIQNGLIESIDSHSSGHVTREFPHAVVLPGLINPHTHLEFSMLPGPLGEPGSPFAQWIRDVVAWRQSQFADAEPGSDSDRWHTAIRRGLSDSLRAGVTVLGEICTRDVGADAYTARGFAGVVFRELLGFQATRMTDQQQVAVRYERQLARRTPMFHWGFSPHAPYTVRWELLEWIVGRAQKYDLPLAMHLAESRAELELLRHGTGPLRECLESLDAWDDQAGARRAAPLDYLRLLAGAQRSLVIHGNYLGPKEREFLAQQAARMTVVYCPRTHAFFRHEPYPLAQMLAEGVRLVIGTDSRASNPDLDLLRELRFAACRHPSVDPAAILNAGTLGAAAALGCDATVGSLTVGKRADLIVVPIDVSAANDPWDALFGTDHSAQLVVRGGVVDR